MVQVWAGQHGWDKYMHPSCSRGKRETMGQAMFVEEVGLVVVVFQKEVSQKIHHCDCVRRLTERLKS